MRFSGFCRKHDFFDHTRKYAPIPSTAAEVIATLPRKHEAIEDIRQNYVAAPLYLHHGTETILVEGRGLGPCGASNCQAYILEKRGETYRLLLDTDVIQQAQVLKSVTKGYHDIQTSRHGSAFLSGLAIYRYDGHQYKLTDCFSKQYDFDVDAKGEAHLAKVTITRTCGSSRTALRQQRRLK
jgi:hypothetical protein